VFLGTYIKADALGGLGILAGPERGPYEVAEPREVPAEVFAYGVCDYWEGALNGLRTVDLTSLTGQPGLPAVFMLPTGTANRLLRAAQAAGFMEVQRSVPPFQVMRRWDSPTEALERVYGP
jgi:hypothetical protein